MHEGKVMKAPKSRTNSKRGVHDLGIFGTESDYVDQDALSCFSLLTAKNGVPTAPSYTHQTENKTPRLTEGKSL